MDKLTITKLNTSKKTVTTNEKFTIKLYAYSITGDPVNERLAFRIGNNKIKE